MKFYPDMNQNRLVIERCNFSCRGVYIDFNPFLPTGQFFAPKLIILVKCLIDVLFFKVLF